MCAQFKELLSSSRMTSDINSKVIGQPGQETDEIGKLSVRRELETHRNLIVRPEIMTETCKSQGGVYVWGPGSTISEDWTYKPLLSHVKFRTRSPAVGDRAIVSSGSPAESCPILKPVNSAVSNQLLRVAVRLL